MSDAVGVTRSGRVATIELNRPLRLNAFSPEMMGELRLTLDELTADESVRALVITGAGRAFCAGADVKILHQLQVGGDIGSFRHLLVEGKRIFLRLKGCPQPVIAAVNGVAAGGGCSLALAADWRLASPEASFVQAFVRIGLHPDFGAYWSLPELAGQARARRLMMTGEPISAARAEEWGLVHEIVPADELMKRAAELAGRLAAGPRAAVAAIKRGLGPPDMEACERLLDFEIEEQVKLFQSADAREGIAAFLEKRAPRFG